MMAPGGHIHRTCANQAIFCKICKKKIDLKKLPCNQSPDVQYEMMRYYYVKYCWTQLHVIFVLFVKLQQINGDENRNYVESVRESILQNFSKSLLHQISSNTMKNQSAASGKVLINTFFYNSLNQWCSRHNSFYIVCHSVCMCLQMDRYTKLRFVM